VFLITFLQGFFLGLLNIGHRLDSCERILFGSCSTPPPLRSPPWSFEYYKESEGQYKYITETKEIVGGMKGVKDSNDSVSPSPLFFAKEFVV
jgi:hypothetical protein